MSGVHVYEPAAGTVVETVAQPDGSQRQVIDSPDVRALPTFTLTVTDFYTHLETLNDQSGAGAVLTFTFTTTPKLIVVFSAGGVSRATLSGTPSSTNGVYCDMDVATYIPVQSQTLKVFANVGTAVSVWGMS